MEILRSICGKKEQCRSGFICGRNTAGSHSRFVTLPNPTQPKQTVRVSRSVPGACLDEQHSPETPASAQEAVRWGRGGAAETQRGCWQQKSCTLQGSQAPIHDLEHESCQHLPLERSGRAMLPASPGDPAHWSPAHHPRHSTPKQRNQIKTGDRSGAGSMGCLYTGFIWGSRTPVLGPRVGGAIPWGRQGTV